MKKMILQGLLLFLTTIWLPGCQPTSTDTIRIATLYGPSAVSFLHMMEHDSLIDGKKVLITILKEPQQVQALMIQGKTDFAILPTLMAANLYNKGLKYQMLACPIWGTLYILNNDTVTQLQNIKGQSIGVMGQGTTPDVLLRRWLNIHKIEGVNPDYSYSTHAELAQAMWMHKLRFAVISEPIVSNLMAKDKSIHIIQKLDCKDDNSTTQTDFFVQTAFLVRTHFAQSQKKLVQKISNAYARSCQSSNEQPYSTAALMLKYQLATELATAKKSIPLCQIRYTPATNIEAEITHFLEIFYHFSPQSIGNKLPDDQFIYRP